MGTWVSYRVTSDRLRHWVRTRRQWLERCRLHRRRQRAPLEILGRTECLARFICKHASSTSIMTCYVSDNHGSESWPQEARVTLKQCTCTENRGRGVYAEGLPKIEYVGNGNRVRTTGPVRSPDEAANHAVPQGRNCAGARAAQRKTKTSVYRRPQLSGASTTEAKRRTLQQVDAH